MTISLNEQNAPQIIAIYQVINLHSFLVSDRQFDRLDEVFTEDVRFRTGGALNADSLEELRAALLAKPGAGKSHHITNTVIDELSPQEALVRSKMITLYDDRIGASVLIDQLVMTERGWRVSARELRVVV